MDNQEYWNGYYKESRLTLEPSNFAKDILDHLNPGNTLIDLGCGNGRDAIFFSENGLHVIAIDLADNAINRLKKEYGHLEIQFICQDFVEDGFTQPDRVDYFYSRFTIHAITDVQQKKLIKNVYKTLKEDGIFFIEVRSVLDDIYGKGEKVGRNAYIYDRHYRRFIVAHELEQALETEGFTILVLDEKRGFAPFGDSDPIVLRVIAKK